MTRAAKHSTTTRPGLHPPAGVSIEGLVVLVLALLVLLGNAAFWQQALAGRDSRWRWG
jgi:hypothetical protein